MPTRGEVLAMARWKYTEERNAKTYSIALVNITIERIFNTLTYDSKRMIRMSPAEVADAVCDTTPFSSAVLHRSVDIVTVCRDGKVWNTIERHILDDTHPERSILIEMLSETYGNDVCTSQIVQQYYNANRSSMNVGIFQEVTCAIKILLLDSTKLTEIGMSRRLELMVPLLKNLEPELVQGLMEWAELDESGVSGLMVSTTRKVIQRL